MTDSKLGKVLITGAAGFIGFHLARRLSLEGRVVVGLDNINDYYDPELKYERLSEAGINGRKLENGEKVKSNRYPNYSFVKLDLKNYNELSDFFKVESFTHVVNLAAQAGVRYSLENPMAYVESNVIGFMNILECCRYNRIQHLTYASSSSVYGLNESMPFSTSHNVDHPISLYAATKKSNELMAHTYSHLYGLPTTGLRFFTVYGPWGRPDMAYFLFTDAISKGEPIKVFNNGAMSRDFTYIDDIVEGVARVNDNSPKGNPNWSGKVPDPSSSKGPYAVYNIGNNAPVKLMEFISVIEKSLGKEAKKDFMPMQAGDVSATYADVQSLIDNLGYQPNTPLEVGVKNFVHWYREFYQV